MAAAEFGITAALLFGFYLLFAGQPSEAEIGFGALAALLVAGFALPSWRTQGRRMRPRAPWGRLAAHAVLSLIRDSAAVARHLLCVLAGRAGGGAVVRRRFASGGHTPPAAARRALVVLTASLAPNTYVLRIEEPGTLLLHRLAPQPPQPEEDRRWPL